MDGYKKGAHLSAAEFSSLSEESKSEYYDRLSEERKLAVTAEDKEILSQAYAALGNYRGAADFSRDLADSARRQHESDVEYNRAKRKKAIIILAAVVAALAIVAVFATVLSMSGAKADEYALAEQLYREGRYEEALKIFESLGEYDDAPLYVLDIKNKNALGKVNGQRASVGDKLTFGSWETDGNAENGKEAIEWMVIGYDSENKRVLMISKDILASASFGDTAVWKNSELRDWLNGDFINGAFTSAERSLIDANIYEEYGEDEDDVISTSSEKISLLSEYELKKYLPDILDAKAEGAGENEWWLRTPSETAGAVVYVADNGRVASLGAAVGESYGVRPIMWVELTY